MLTTKLKNQETSLKIETAYLSKRMAYKEVCCFTGILVLVYSSIEYFSEKTVVKQKPSLIGMTHGRKFKLSSE